VKSVSFCISAPNFVQIREHTAEIWRHIYFSRRRPRPLNTTSGFVFCWCQCLQNVISANQISSRYLNWRLRHNYFRFWKTNIRHIGILLPVSISTISLNRRIILHPAAEFRPNRKIHCQNMTSYRFSRWRVIFPLFGGSPHRTDSNQIKSNQIKFISQHKTTVNNKWI